MKYRSVIFQAVFLTAIALCLANVGCSLLGISGKSDEAQGKKDAAQVKTVTDAEGNPLLRFSQNPNSYYSADRQYKRVTRNKIEEESDLQSQAGSMWVMEGQGAYLFTQNKTRREGDLLNIQIEGAAQKQVETKVSVIKKLLKQLEEEQEKRNLLATPPAANTNLADAKPGADRAPASTPVPVAPVAAAKKEEKEEPLSIESVPTRIVERMPDGNYRIKGAQPFMIGKREYKVLVTGMIRSEDFNDQAAVSSNKILDPQFDVVSIRRSQQ